MNTLNSDTMSKKKKIDRIKTLVETKGFPTHKTQIFIQSPDGKKEFFCSVPSTNDTIVTVTSMENAEKYRKFITPKA